MTALARPASHANSLTGEDREGVVSAIDFLLDDSQLAGGGFSALGNLGHFSWVIVAIAASVALYRAGAPRAATSISVLFASHAGLGAAAGLVALFVAELLALRGRSAAGLGRAGKLNWERISEPTA